MIYKTTSLIVITLLLGMSQAVAGEKPPENSMKLSEIVKSLESQGYSPITEISIDNGVWEAEAYKEGKERELKINPVNAKIISDRPDN
jgi:hypothetical protein